MKKREQLKTAVQVERGTSVALTIGSGIIIGLIWLNREASVSVRLTIPHHTTPPHPTPPHPTPPHPTPPHTTPPHPTPHHTTPPHTTLKSCDVLRQCALIAPPLAEGAVS